VSDVTQILSQIESGDPKAAEQLLPLVYEELRKLATAKLAQEKPGQTLQATALVHEAFLRLMGAEKAQPWNTRGHFFAAAAEAMRRILIEVARRKNRRRHLGARQPMDLEATATLDPCDRTVDLLALDEALTALAAVEPEKAAIVKLRYFCGLAWDEVAACRGISVATAKRHWMVARAWLYDALCDGETSKSDRNS
jgi:RNA polymerase sigma factor (TIGR02999 family)